MGRLLAAAFVLPLMLSPALAQSTGLAMPSAQAPAPVTGPCSRGASSFRVGGVSFDELKCVLAVATQRLSEREAELIDALADARMLKLDLAAASAQLAREREYWKSYIGAGKPKD